MWVCQSERPYVCLSGILMYTLSVLCLLYTCVPSVSVFKCMDKKGYISFTWFTCVFTYARFVFCICIFKIGGQEMTHFSFLIFLIRPFPQMSFFHFQISSFTIIASYWHGQRALTNSFIYKFMSNKNDAVVFCVTSPKIDTKNINTKSIFPIHTWSLISFTCKRNVCRYLLSK